MKEPGWFADHMNFTTGMIAVIAVVILFGILLIVCVLKYPSFDYPENLARKGGRTLFRGRRKVKSRSSFKSQKSGDDKRHSGNNSQIALVRKPSEDSNGLGVIERLPFDNGTTFHRAANDGRLPTAGDTSPHGRLPPLGQQAGLPLSTVALNYLAHYF